MARSKWQPSKADYNEAIRSQNPWQGLGAVPAELAPPTQRPLAKVLWKTLIGRQAPRHQLILGPRRVGKTTVMYQTVEKLRLSGIPVDRLWWLRLDHPLLMDWSLGDLVRQIQTVSRASATNPVYILLDELTYAEKWDLWLKAFSDEKWPVRIVGTSSATAAIRKRGIESGVGRWDEHFLAPYLFTEFLDLRELDSGRVACAQSLGQTLRHLVESSEHDMGLSELRRQYLLTGGFPELLLGLRRRTDQASELLRSQRVLRSDAIEKAVYKDIPQAFKIEEPSKLERLLYTLAGQMTGVVSPQAVAADIGVASPTVERYIGYLERAFLVFLLANYSASEEAVQRRGRKLYFFDGALRNAALLRGLSPMNNPHEMGLLVENMAASHLRALAYQENVRLFHWRLKENCEVDLVYDHPDDPVAFEITSATSHHQRGIAAFQRKFSRFKGRCYLVSDSAEVAAPQPGSPGRLPLDLFFLAVGRQEQSALENRIHVAETSDVGSQRLLF